MNSAAKGSAAQASPESLLQSAEGLLKHRDLPAARWAFDRAETAGGDPDTCSAGRWLTAMLGGNFEMAWRQSDAIRERGAPEPHRFWQGEDIRGRRVIVRSLHGLGDAVQMMAYAPALRALASHVVWEVPPRLLALARLFECVDDVITWGEDAPRVAPAWEVQIEITELPYLFRTLEEDLPIANGYLHLPGAEVQRAAAAMGSRTQPRVGVVWACGEWNPSRNLPSDLVQRVLGTAGLAFWSLQGSGQAEQAHSWPIRNALEVCGDGLLALAATIANLDLVITPDTLQAHLAAVLGVPVWVLLQHEADWRWMVNRSDSPWYPSLRIFRQRVPGDWAGIFEQVERTLPRVLPLR